MNKIFSFLLFLSINTLQANVHLANIFADNMVLQHHSKIPVWGWSNANEKITVKFNQQSKTTSADSTGKWIVYLDEENAGGPYVLNVKGKNTIQINNVLVGEVWICSGQSNMEWTVGQSENATKEIETANTPLIRHIKIPKEINSDPNKDFISVPWETCSPQTVANFTAVGYYFAKERSAKLNIAIGLINASWGGTNIETWISKEGFESDAEFREMIQSLPKINLDSLLILKIEATKRQIETLQKAEIDPKKSTSFNLISFNDSNWPEMNQPSIWEEQQLGNLDGVVWLRKHFTLEKVSGAAVLEIPAIDDNDITYVNGIKVGETIGWDKKRTYQIPAEILKTGQNIIAIRVEDTGGGGGIHGNENELKIKLNETEITLNGKWKFQVEVIQNSLNPNEFPSLCYNAMIHPLIPFAFKGVLWYQGETNAPRAHQYRKSFPLLINDWRKKSQSDFPFYYVQLATFITTGNSNEGCEWAELREAQTTTLSVKNTAMVVTTDIGDPNDIHPINKKTVGNRLGAIALKNLNQENIICSGPSYQSFKNIENQTIITFDNIGNGLITSNEIGIVNGFEVAGDDQIFYPAKAFIKDNKVIASCEKVPSPIAVRFGWIGDASLCNLFNKEGYPAVPFRTDDWKTITTEEKYKLSIH